MHQRPHDVAVVMSVHGYIFFVFKAMVLSVNALCYAQVVCKVSKKLNYKLRDVKSVAKK